MAVMLENAKKHQKNRKIEGGLRFCTFKLLYYKRLKRVRLNNLTCLRD